MNYLDAITLFVLLAIIAWCVIADFFRVRQERRDRELMQARREKKLAVERKARRVW